MKRSGQCPSPLNCPWLKLSTSLDSLQLNWKSHLAQQISLSSHNGQRSERPFYTREQLALYLTHCTGSHPETLRLNQENKRLIPPLPLQTPTFSFKNFILALPQACSWSRLSLPVISPAPNKGIWIRSSGSSRLSLSHMFLTVAMDAKNCSCHCVRHTHHTGQHLRSVDLLQGDQRQTSCAVTLLVFLAQRSLEHMAMPASWSSSCKLQIHV